MYRLIQDRIKYLLFLLIYITCFSSCKQSTSDKDVKRVLTPSEILSHFIRKKTNTESVEGVYVFACGPYCKGCVQAPLFALDSIYGDLIKQKKWTFFTSHEFVIKYQFNNIDFLFDSEWEKINFKFEDVIVIKFSNDSIVYAQKLTTLNIEDILNQVTND